jgi:hypothetical protein
MRGLGKITKYVLINKYSANHNPKMPNCMPIFIVIIDVEEKTNSI